MLIVPVTLSAFYLGGLYMQIFLGILAGLMLWELGNNFKKTGLNIPVTMLIFGVILYISIVTVMDYLVIAVLFVSLLFISGRHIFGNDADGAVQKVATAMFCMFYVAFFLGIIYRLRLLPEGRSIVVSLLLLTWLTDTMAYVTGMALGRHRGVIGISPNKSVEGFVGGALFCLAGSRLLAGYFHLPDSYIWMLALSTGIIGQYGDLFESLIKRDLKIKDSSRILSEHGGILDRFDSILMSGPALYILIKIMETL